MACNNPCFEVSVPKCTDIVLDVGLSANTNYAITVEKIGKNRTQQRQLETNDQGQLIIDPVEHFPGFFTFGAYRIQLRKVDTYPEIQELTIQGQPYECLLISVGTLSIHEADDTPANVIK